ncbi:hypothetical protein [Methyloligella solikamskensis]|uniref:Uncharacterized protein n=1 Tax=Methyloligella solikamskensis TaxID=1177756 RepID=A0ABW3JC28_9HYPH
MLFRIPTINISAVFDIYGLDLLINEDQFQIAAENFRNRSYASSDLVWPIVLVGDRSYRIFYINYYEEPYGIESVPSCFDFEDVNIEIESPGFENGQKNSGTITVWGS